MSDRVATTTGPFVRGPSYEEDARMGRMTTYLYTGSFAECAAQRNICRLQGAAYLMLGPGTGGDYELRVSFPWGENGQTEETTDTHELEVNVAMPSVYQSPRVRSMILEENLGKTKNVIEEFQVGKIKTPTAAYAQLATLVTDATQNSRCDALFELVALREATGFMEWTSVYRRTITAASPKQITASRVGEELVWTSAEIIAHERFPAAWYFGITSASFWIKSKPSIIVAARQKVQISYYYTEAKYISSLLYSPYSGATSTSFYYSA